MIKKKLVEKEKFSLTRGKGGVIINKLSPRGRAEKPEEGRRKGLTRVAATCYYITPR